MDYKAKLITTEGNKKRIIEVNSDNFSLGRAANCNYVLKNIEISRIQCILRKLESGWEIIDRSTNGTMVNGNVLKNGETALLKSGDKIELIIHHGSLIFQFEIDEPLVAKIDDLPLDVEEQIVALAEAAEKEQDLVAKNGESSKQNIENDNLEELTCSICTELFIKAITLQCSHSFCEFCIKQWRRNKKECPICRGQIITCTPTLVLDNFIEKIVARSDDLKKNREQLIKEREELMKNCKDDTKMVNYSFIELSSDDGDSDLQLDEEGDSDFDMDDEHDYTGLPGHYYGGYGRCYNCGERGHWANGCPYY